MASSAAVLARPRLGAPPVTRVPPAVRWTLPNGLRVIAVRRGAVPQVVMRMIVPAGSAADPAAYPGTAALVGHLLLEGTEALPADALHARIDLLGASFHTNVGHDFAEVEATLLTETLAEGVDLLAELVMRSTFPPDETERVRAESLDALIARRDEPANVADDRVLPEVYGEEHPYGRPSFGTEEGVTAVPREALVDFHARHYRPEGAFLVAAGAFDEGALRAALERAFGEWAGTCERAAYPATPPRALSAGRTLLTHWDEAAQSEIRVAATGIDRRSPDWVPGAVANYILGGSTITGRLGANLREDKGWTYGVHSAFSAGVARGGWLAQTAVDVEVTAAALHEMLAEMRRMTEEPVTETELRRAREALVLSLPRAFETPAQVASRFATLEAYGLPPDWWDRYPAAVAAVTADDVLRIAGEHFHPDHAVRVVVGGGFGEEEVL